MENNVEVGQKKWRHRIKTLNEGFVCACLCDTRSIVFCIHFDPCQKIKTVITHVYIFGVRVREYINTPCIYAMNFINTHPK